MFQPEREKRILDHLLQMRIATPAQLQELTGASIATVRRDLNSLENQGLLKRYHGYVQLADPAAAAKTSLPLAYEAKEKISLAAAAQIHDGDTIFLGSGTTCNCLARHLMDKRNLTIMTINLDMLSTLNQIPGVKLSILGGTVHIGNGYLETMDEYTIQILKRLFFDKTFVTVDGIDFQYGYSIRLQLQLSLFQHLLNNSKEFYCLADASKFNRRTYMQFCPFDAIHKIVTTADVRDRFARQFDAHGVQVICE